MGIPSLLQTGRSGMTAAKAGIATTGHNIANATTEGFSRQRVQTSAETPRATFSTTGSIGEGVRINRIERVNDEYVEKQLRNCHRDLSNLEEKDIVLKQTEDIFNEMNGDGLNRLIARFFNEFRKLSNEPDNEAVRQSVREASQAMINDFHRIRKEVDEVRQHIDSRLEGYVGEVNSLAEELKDLNLQIRRTEIGGASANDLQDKRDKVFKQMAGYMDLSMHKDKDNNFVINISGVGPLVAGPAVEKFEVFRTPADGQGKAEGAMDMMSSASASGTVTRNVKGGKIGALLETRDKTLASILDRLDELAFSMTQAVNEIHQQGFTRHGAQGVSYFANLGQKDRAAEFIQLSDEVTSSVSNIATAAIPDAPGDNRIAIAISGLQGHKMMNRGTTTMDDFYNSIVSDVGVAAARTHSATVQQKDIQTQLSKMRDQISGVSIDEETTNLLQFQHTFDASAKVISVADELLKTVLDLKR